MKKILATLAALFFTAPAGAQSVQQSGFVSPGHVPYFVTNGVIGDAGTSVNSKLTSIGTTGPGPTICANSAPQTGPYNQLCLSANSSGAAQIILQNFGGAAAQNMQFVINGTTYSFPFVATGVVGPGSTTIGDAACWNNTIGTLLSDCGIPVTGPSVVTLTNKTITDSSNTLGGVTAGFGSDAKGDIYINSGSVNVIQRLTIGSTGQCLVVAAGLPSWGGCTTGITVGTTNVSGGVAGNLLYTDGTKLQASTGVTWVGNGQLALALGTITTNLSAISITGTFNAGGTTFDAPFLMNITNSASNSASLLMDLQVGSASVFNVKINGNPTFVNQSGGSTIVLASGGAASSFASTPVVLLETSRGTVASPTNVSNGDQIGGFLAVPYVSGAYAFNAYAGFTIDGVAGTGGTAFIMATGSASTRVIYAQLGSSGIFNYYNGASLAFASATTSDAGLSRTAAATLAIGNGAANDTTGTLVAAHATLNALANVATTSAVCYNVGTGVLTYDGTIGTCNTSTMRVKHDIEPLHIDALSRIMAMRPVSFYYNDEQHTPGEQIGLIAEDLAAIDSRLVSYDEQGQPNAIRFLGPLHAYEIGAIQELARRVDNLERKLH